MASPAATYKFAGRDTCDLFLDFYPASKGSYTEIDGKQKPAIIFAFGGGFIGGHRDKPHYQQWIKLLNDNGYPVFSIDLNRDPRDGSEVDRKRSTRCNLHPGRSKLHVPPAGGFPLRDS